MNRLSAMSLLSEAKATLITVKSFFGSQSAPVEALCFKWPDVVESVLDDDVSKFSCDMAYLICVPIGVIAEALISRLYALEHNSVVPDVLPDVLLDILEVKDIIRDSYFDPISSKKNLVRICNNNIVRLKEYGVEVSLL